ncbi:hypothetical protein A0J61_06554 [Choanephora cucurbitarum]|uniref:Uncharacterized protein n=1 Tax=Choanephora cucurbitarum TaxID=101091 RepID=A0A1C7N8I1_9FUNG|nr:hypothetical protein A0J61_06554 [Choanephora cucurbitarum]
MQHSVQYHQHITLREFLYQLMNTFKHSFDSKAHRTSHSCQSEVEKANAKLSQFEKTYVSFPEFVDIDAEDGRRRFNQEEADARHWFQHKTLAC